MDPDELEALIGGLGTRGVASFGVVPAQLVQIGPPLFPILLRVLEDHEYRLMFWEQYGKPHEGELIHTRGLFPEHTVSPTRYDQTLRANVIYILGRRREFKLEPLHCRLRAAAEEAFNETYPGEPLDQPAPDSEQNQWEDYLDACAALDLELVHAYWQGRDDDQNAADCGLCSALVDNPRGVNNRLSSVVKFLLEKGGNIDEELQENIGCVALQYAAQNDDPERVRWLLSHGADVSRSDADGCTALMFALRGDGLVGPRDTGARRAVLRALLDAGADPAFQKRTQYEDFKFVSPALWRFVDAEGEALLAEFGIFRLPGTGIAVD